MAWQELPNLRRESARVYRDDVTGERGVSCHVMPIHYEGTIGSGVFDSTVDCQLQRVTNAELDGYETVVNGWHYRIQTVNPAASTEQPNTQRPIGSTGFGGRQGQHWFWFVLEAAGFLHGPSLNFQTLPGMAIDYDPANIAVSVSAVIASPRLNEPVNTAGILEWRNLWQTPNGGTVSLRWTVKSHFLKEEIVIDELARTFIEANLPNPVNRHMGFRFELDHDDIPRRIRDGVLLNPDDDFADDGESIVLENATGDVLASFLPLDFMFVPNRGGRRDLRKRFYTQGNTHYLVLGVAVSDLTGLLPGPVIFDPAIAQQIVTANADDCTSDGGSNLITPAYDDFYIGSYQSTSQSSGWRFAAVPDIGQADTINTASIDLFRRALEGAPTLRIIGNDKDDPPVWADGTGSNRPNDMDDGVGGEGDTTAQVDWDSGFGSDNAYVTSPDIANIVQEIVDRTGWAADQAMRFAIRNDGASGTNYMQGDDVASGGSGNNGARFDANFTAASTEDFVPHIAASLHRLRQRATVRM